MPKFNRRNFLQITSAAGLVPIMPAMLVQAATVAPVNAAQMLWAGMLSRANTGPKLAALGQTMGLTGRAAVGISAKLAAAQVIGSETASQIAVQTSKLPVQPPRAWIGPKAQNMQRDILRFLTEDPQEEELELVDAAANDDIDQIEI